MNQKISGDRDWETEIQDKEYVFDDRKSSHAKSDITANALEKLKKKFDRQYPQNWALGKYFYEKKGMGPGDPLYCEAEVWLSNTTGFLANERTRVHIDNNNMMIVLCPKTGEIKSKCVSL